MFPEASLCLSHPKPSHAAHCCPESLCRAEHSPWEAHQGHQCFQHSSMGFTLSHNPFSQSEDLLKLAQGHISAGCLFTSSTETSGVGGRQTSRNHGPFSGNSTQASSSKAFVPKSCGHLSSASVGTALDFGKHCINLLHAYSLSHVHLLLWSGANRGRR